jgi:hypothetical protein
MWEQVQVALLDLAFVTSLHPQELSTRLQLVVAVLAVTMVAQVEQQLLLMQALLVLLQMAVMEEHKTVIVSVTVDLQVLT